MTSIIQRNRYHITVELVLHALTGSAKGLLYSLAIALVCFLTSLSAWVVTLIVAWIIGKDDNNMWLVTSILFWATAFAIVALLSLLKSLRSDLADMLRSELSEDKQRSLGQAELSILDDIRNSYTVTVMQLSFTSIAFAATSLAWNEAYKNIFTSTDISDAQVLAFTIDLICRGLLFDVMEHFDLSFTEPKLNRGNWLYMAFSFVFRIYVSLLILKTVIRNFSIYVALRRGAPEFERAYKVAVEELGQKR